MPDPDSSGTYFVLGLRRNHTNWGFKEDWGPGSWQIFTIIYFKTTKSGYWFT